MTTQPQQTEDYTLTHTLTQTHTTCNKSKANTEAEHIQVGDGTWKKITLLCLKKDGCTIFDGTLFLSPVHLSQAAHSFKHHHVYNIKNILNNTVASKRTSEHDVNMAALNTGPHVFSFVFCFLRMEKKKKNTLWLHLVGAKTATSRKAWAMAKKTTKKREQLWVDTCS